MRMFFLATIILASSGAGAALPSLADASRCPDNPTAHLARPSERVAPRKLADLPPGQTFAAVYRRDERGCMVPVLYSERYRPPAQRKTRP